MGEVVLVQGAALGAALELLFMSVFDAARKLVLFESRLTRLKSTLSSIKLLTDDFVSFNRITVSEACETEELFTRRLLQGDRFIQKCARVKKWNLFKRLYYAHRLTELQASLDNFFQIDVAALHFWESKRISVRVGNLEDKMNEVTNILKSINETGTLVCSSELVQPCQQEKELQEE